MNKYFFTTLPSNDGGLLAQSLPIARELRDRGHQITFCSQAKTPRKLISEAGFDNLLPDLPSYYLISGDTGFESFIRLLHSRHLKRDAGILISLIKQASQSNTAEVWNIDHFMYLFGMWNEAFVRAALDALTRVIDAYDPDVIVDFWNPLACMAAKVQSVPYPFGRIFRGKRQKAEGLWRRIRSGAPD